jgi:hypothetical protein
MVCSFYCRTFSRIALSQSPSRARVEWFMARGLFARMNMTRRLKRRSKQLCAYLPQRRDARQKSRLFARRN